MGAFLGAKPVILVSLSDVRSAGVILCTRGRSLSHALKFGAGTKILASEIMRSQFVAAGALNQIRQFQALDAWMRLADLPANVHLKLHTLATKLLLQSIRKSASLSSFDLFCSKWPSFPSPYS